MMRWWWVLGVLACTPESSQFGPDALPDAVAVDQGAMDMAPTDRGVDGRVIDLGVDMAADMAPDLAVDMAPDQAVDMVIDMAPDLAVDMAPDQAVDMAIDMTVDMAPDMAVDMAPDMAIDMTVDMAIDMAPDMGEGPLCGSARRLTADGVLGLFGPVDIPAYQGCNIVGPAWGAFIELDAPRTVTLKAGNGFVQRGVDCFGGMGTCATGPNTFDLPAGRTDFVIINSDTVRVVSTPQCDNGADDDADGLIDLDDPGCARPDDPSETNPPAVTPACSNGRDDDGDARADWPFDLGCPSPGSAVEVCPGIAPSAITSTTPERLDLRAAEGRLLALDCVGVADMVEVLLVAPFSGVVDVRVDPVGGQALELRRGCDAIVGCTVDRVDGRLAVQVGDTIRARIHGRPEWLEWSMAPPVACGNGLDDDGDGRVDLADPGCRSVDDPTEGDPIDAPVCSNGIDDDRDRATDFPEEFACLGPGGSTEEDACAVALGTEAASGDHWLPRALLAGECGGDDTAETGLTMPFRRPHFIRVASGTAYVRADCADGLSEQGCVRDGGVLGPIDGDATIYLEGDAALAEPAFVPVRRCANGIDDDGDGLVDLDDRGCTDRFDDDETDPEAPTACSDEIDNDGDGATDWPDDPQCDGIGDPSEAQRCPDLPDVAPIDRLTQIGNMGHLPITESVDDGRPVHAVLIPFLIDRPGRRFFDGNEAVNWIPLIDCAPAREEIGFGIDRDVRPEVGQLTMRLEVDVAAAHPWIEFGAITPDCRNRLDDDGDGLIDGADPGCARQPATEVDAPEAPECADGIDNDGDGAIDVEDAQCIGANDLYEGGVCVDDLVVAPVTESTTRWVMPEGSPRFNLPCGPGTLQRSAVIPLILDRAAQVIVRTAEAKGDPVLTLESDCRRPIACGDDGAPGLQAQVAALLDPGRYAIRVGRWRPNEVEPIRVLIEIR